jgi:ribosomal protein S25
MKMRVRPKADTALGWAYRPDSDTVAALTRGRAKLREHPELGSDRPHYGGNLAEALAAERKADQKRRNKKGNRRKKMAKRVTASRKKTRVSKEVETDGKIPLKTLCAQLGVDPKAARVKLRRLKEDGELSFHDHSSRWEFTKAQAKQIRAALS